MKMTVIADKDGTILGTYRQPKHVPKGYPIFKIHGGPDHSVHELDLPKEFEHITSADELPPARRSSQKNRSAPRVIASAYKKALP